MFTLLSFKGMSVFYIVLWVKRPKAITDFGLEACQQVFYNEAFIPGSHMPRIFRVQGLHLPFLFCWRIETMQVQRNETSRAKSRMNTWKTTGAHERRWGNEQQWSSNVKSAGDKDALGLKGQVNIDNNQLWNIFGGKFLLLSFFSMSLYLKTFPLSDYAVLSFKFDDLTSYSQHSVTLMYTYINRF